MYSCASALAGPGELRLVVVEERDELLAVAPLIKRAGRYFAEFLGSSEFGEPTDALCADERGVHALARALASFRLPLLLNRVPAGSRLPAALQEAYRRSGILLERPAASSPSFVLSASGGDPDKGLNPGRRSDLRRARRKADDLGAVSFDLLSPRPEALDLHLEEAFAVEASGWKGEGRSAITLNPKIRAFMLHYACEASEKGILRISFMRIDGKAVAMQFAMETMGRLWLFKIGYDERFSACSPGNLLLMEVIRDAARRGLESVEFLGVLENWTRPWTSKEISCSVLRGYPFAWAGAACLAMDLVKFSLNRARKAAAMGS